MRKLTCGIFTDTFPPNIGGVSTVAINYARSIESIGGRALVMAPWYPSADDTYLFKVMRYSSAKISDRLGYRVGNPFSPRLIGRIIKEDLDIIHVHSPFISTILARVVRQYTGVPIVLTYHSKFDVDIEKRILTNALRIASIQLMLRNIQACDEVWVVSEEAGENLKSLGFRGTYRLMENGTDFKNGRAGEDRIVKLEEKLQLTGEEIVLLFVGRMMWYKNLKLLIDGLAGAKASGGLFKMIFVGEGMDLDEIKAYVAAAQLSDVCLFTGAVDDRENLRDYYSRADLFLFPSTYDTNGIVVREAAACGCPSLLVRGSGAAEGIVHDETGILIDETAEGLTYEVLRACSDKVHLREIGQRASEKIYLSWDDAVSRAYARYEQIIDRQEIDGRIKAKQLEKFLDRFRSKEDILKHKNMKSTIRKCERMNLMDELIHKYREPHYNLSCSEATLSAANEAYELELDVNALKMMAGFSGGLMTEDLCGVIAGGVATLSVLLTQGVAHDSPELKEAVKLYLDRVDAHFGSRLCSEIKKTHRDIENNTCDPVIFQHAEILDEIVNSYRNR